MQIDSFILVGGRSSRLGRDKAFVQLGGESLYERAATTLKQAFQGENITLVGSKKQQFGDTEPFLKYPVIYDIYPDRGPLGALHAALRNAASDWIAILACDLPFVSAKMLQRLTIFISDDHDAVVPVQPDGRFQPLAALYRVERCFTFLNEKLRKDNETPALASVLEKLTTQAVPFAEISDIPGSENFFLNINNPGDLENAQRLNISAV